PIVSVHSATQQYTCTTPSDSFSASCIVLADGVESKLARDLGWDTELRMEDIETCAFCHITHDAINEEAIEFHVGSNNAPGGFVWVFPRGGKKANVGLGMLGIKHKSGRAEELLNQFINRNFPHAQIDNLHCGGVPVGKWLNPLVKNGVLIAGDAARQVNSLTGGGIAYALYAGRIAGETVAKAKTSSGISYNRLKGYQKEWQAYCGKQQMRSYALKSMLLKKDNDTFYDSIAHSLAKEDPQ
ncbi:MAG: NAD(P)/FAD-dependent oxidoreductase, partial [bacterium]|nr:NAD(P)/FAD-dependent oxidoreductase [bacterium]